VLLQKFQTWLAGHYQVDIWYGGTRMVGLQSVKGHMMSDSVVWAQYINVTDMQTDSHVAAANAAPAHCVGWQKLKPLDILERLVSLPSALEVF